MGNARTGLDLWLALSYLQEIFPHHVFFWRKKLEEVLTHGERKDLRDNFAAQLRKLISNRFKHAWLWTITVRAQCRMCDMPDLAPECRKHGINHVHG